MDNQDLDFRFTLDISDIEDAPKRIEKALDEIAKEAKAKGENADIAMANYVKQMMQERENALATLQKALEDARKRVEETRKAFAEDVNKNTEKDYDEAVANYDRISDAISDVRGEMVHLELAEQDLAENRSFATSLKLKAQNLDLYGNAMKLLPSPIANVVKANAKLDASLKKLLANPVVLIIAAVVLAVKMLGDALKGLGNYADWLGERFDGVAYVFGLVTEATRKMVEVVKAVFSLDWESLEYNLKTMFDGGERELEKRNEKILQAEEDKNRKLRDIENHWLRRRINNTALSYKERLDANKKFSENEIKNEQDRYNRLEREYKLWLDSVAMYDERLNAKGTKKDVSLLSKDEYEQYLRYQSEFETMRFQIQTRKEEARDREYKIWEKQFEDGINELQKRAELYEKQKKFQRMVSDQLEAETQRLKQLARDTDNAVLQAQINDMADGIEKASKSAELKAKQSLEQLNDTLYNEAKKLYENEKAIFEGNPNNEGKMFKRFNFSQYEAKAKQNIGYSVRKGLIDSEEMREVKKYVDDIVKKSVDGATKVSQEIGDTLRKIQTEAGDNAPTFGDTYERYMSGLEEWKRSAQEYNNITQELKKSESELMSLQMERTKIMMELNREEDPKKRLALAEKLNDTEKQVNTEREKAVGLLEKQANASKKVGDGIAKLKSNLTTVVGSFASAFSSLKGINDNLDQTAETLEQMFSMAENVMNGDVVGAMTQVATFIADKLAETIKAKKQMDEEIKKAQEELATAQQEVQQALTKSALDYKLALIDAKNAQDALYDTTKINAMINAQHRLEEVTKEYDKYVDNIAVRRGRYGTTQGTGLNAFVGSLNRYQIDGQMLQGDQIRNINDIINEQFNSYLFTKNSNGEYELNTKLWESLKQNEATMKMFTDEQVQVIDNIATLQAKIAEAQQEMAESMADWYSPLLDNMTDAWMDWLDTGEDVMDKFKDYSADTFRQIVKDQLKQNIYKEVFKPYIDNLTKETTAFIKGEEFDNEGFAVTLADKTKTMMADFESKSKSFKDLLEAYDTALEGIGLDINGETSGRTAEARGIARASQESVDENNARLAMMQQHTYSINANVSQLLQTSEQMLLHLQGIHNNTNELQRLERIEKSLSNIETYGITTK